MDSPCDGCGTPLNFLHGEPVRAKGGFYHPNCIPSHSPEMDKEYYAGIRDGYQRYLDKLAFGEEYADAADLAREMRREGYAWDMPTPPTGTPDHPARRPVPGVEYPKLTGYDLKTLKGCRDAYRAARRYVVDLSYAGSAAYKSNELFDAAVKEAMVAAKIDDPTPFDWVNYAHRVRFTCNRCGGSGMFVTYVENGKPKGPGGECFRCQGKGQQTVADAHRNFWHGMKWNGGGR